MRLVDSPCLFIYVGKDYWPIQAETMKTNGTVMRVLNILKRFLEHRQLPIFLAIGAIAVMLPALKLGLVADDLPQRVIELRPEQLPPHMCETGMLPSDSGSLPTALFDRFGLSQDPQCVASMKIYGALPWLFRERCLLLSFQCRHHEIFSKAAFFRASCPLDRMGQPSLEF